MILSATPDSEQNDQQAPSRFQTDSVGRDAVRNGAPNMRRGGPCRRFTARDLRRFRADQSGIPAAAGRAAPSSRDAAARKERVASPDCRKIAGRVEGTA